MPGSSFSGKHLAQTGAEVKGGSMDQPVVAVTQKDVDQPDKRRIAKHLPLGHQIAVQCRVVATHHLTDDGQLGLTGLQDDQSATVLATGTPADL